MASKHTTSIVDISEIEDDEPARGGPLADEATGTTSGGQQQQQQRREPASQQLYLYHEDLNPQQRIPNLLSSMVHCAPAASSQAGDISPGATLLRQQSQPQHQLGASLAIDYQPLQARSPGQQQQQQAYSGSNSPAPEEPRSNTPAAPQSSSESKANLGTLSGVYFPCVQNIFGVILFIRMVWIVGTAGVPAAFALVFICCCVTLTTSISLSAIATNGIVPAGGSYFMISRSLGPECGGAVGTMFFLGTTVAGAMYITGAVEIMLNYLAPSWGLFGDFQRDVSILYHNIRVYGTLLLLLVGLMVYVGVKFVSKLAPIALFCVLFSIFSIYAGIFINYNGRPDLMLCVIGDRLATLKNMPYEELPVNVNVNGIQAGVGVGGGSNLYSTGGGEDNARQAGGGAQHFNASQQMDGTLYQMRRTKALCTFERLSHVYCPNEPSRERPGASGPQDSSETPGQQELEPGQQAQAEGAPEEPVRLDAAQERQRMLELFRRPPNMSNCDPYFIANRDRIHLEKAVPGIASGVLFQNLQARFREKRSFVSYDTGTNPSEHESSLRLAAKGIPNGHREAHPKVARSDYNYVFVDITTSFTILISIYFPSCTGILAGSNRSGDLADAQKSIPRGTIAAQLTTSFVYLSCIVLFGSTFNNLFIRDKFGESMGGQLAVTQIAWPHPYVILIGGLLSTLGASLQSLVGAPRILQGIAKDEVIPCFNRFAKLSPRGEPELAILFTLAVSWLAVLIGNLDFIAPILTLSLVMCYFFINLACTLHSLLGSPNWRPRFKHYHWSISTLGCLLCLFVMIVSSLLYFLVAIFLAGCIYKYIEFSGAEKEWGDGKQGLALSAARYNLLRLRTSEPHTKNWRPQLLLFCKLKPASELEPMSARATTTGAHYHRQRQAHLQLRGPANGSGPQPARLASLAEAGPAPASPEQHLHGAEGPELLEQLRVAHPKLLTFASQLKAGKGLTLVSAVIEGDYKRAAPVASRARQTLQEGMQEEKVKGFADVLIAPSIMDGLAYQIQAAGLGGLKHNTVIVGWPARWRRSMAGAPGAKEQQQQQQQRGSFKCPAGQPAANHQQQQTQAGEQQKAQTQATWAGPQLPSSRAHQFIELMRNVQVSQNALLVVKGVDSWPESCDRLGGSIDIWWIVNDGGLLMLLPHLLKQHRTWKSCQLRIFTVAQANDNSMQMRADLSNFLYHLRIEAQVDIVEMNNAEISDYAYERTLMMEQRTEIIKRLGANRKQSLLLEQEVDGRMIRFRIRKPSTCDFEDTGPHFLPGSGSSCASVPATPGLPSSGHEHYPMVELPAVGQQQTPVHEPPGASQLHSPVGAFEMPAAPGSLRPEIGASAEQAGEARGGAEGNSRGPSATRPSLINNLRPDEANVRRMHTALTLNEAILKRSKSAKLVIINLPGAPKASTPEAENNYMEFIEIITDKLERVLLVQNGGREVITIHS